VGSLGARLPVYVPEAACLAVDNSTRFVAAVPELAARETTMTPHRQLREPWIRPTVKRGVNGTPEMRSKSNSCRDHPGVALRNSEWCSSTIPHTFHSSTQQMMKTTRMRVHHRPPPPPPRPRGGPPYPRGGGPPKPPPPGGGPPYPPPRGGGTNGPGGGGPMPPPKNGPPGGGPP